jgi:hypothetical protein
VDPSAGANRCVSGDEVPFYSAGDSGFGRVESLTDFIAVTASDFDKIMNNNDYFQKIMYFQYTVKQWKIKK